MCQETKDNSPSESRMTTNNSKQHDVDDDKATVHSSAAAAVASVEHSNYRWWGASSLALVVIASSLLMPHMQGQRDELGCDSMCLGSMTSARSALTLVGSALVGHLSDSHSRFSYHYFGGSRKMWLLIGIVASALSLWMSQSAASISALWISMIPTALLQQNFNVLKALFADYNDALQSTASERAANVGLLGMAVGLAFMLGPLAGAVLLTNYLVSSRGAHVCLVFAAWMVTQLPTPPAHLPSAASTKKPKLRPTTSGLIGYFNLPTATLSPPAMLLMVIRVCMALSYQVFQTIWTVALKERFHFGPSDYGKFMSFIGLAYALSQGVLAKWLLDVLGGNTSNKRRTSIVLVCSALLGLGRYFAYQTDSLVIIYMLFAAIVTALGVVNTIFSADASWLAPPEERGGLFGMLSAADSAAGMAGPLLGGLLAHYIHPVQAPLFCVVGLYGVVIALVWWGYESLVLSTTDRMSKLAATESASSSSSHAATPSQRVVISEIEPKKTL